MLSGRLCAEKMTRLQRLNLPLWFAVLTVCTLPLRAAGQAPPAPARKGEATWNVLGRSLEDRVIEYRQFGEGERQVLVVGPLEGDETAALELLESLAEHLERFPRRTSGVQVTLVRDPNPDGRLRRTAGNAHGVLLNRNFPTQGWRKLPSGNLWLSGRVPESEPEVRTLIDLFGDVQPDRVIVLTATRRQASVSYVGPAETLARDVAKASGLRPGAFDLGAEQGSLAAYAGADRKLATLVVRVPAGMRREALWTTYKRGLLAAIGGDISAEEPDAESDSLTPSTVSDGTPPQPHAVLAATSRPPVEQSTDAAADAIQTVLEPEVESAGELVPVVPVRREQSQASRPSSPAPRVTQPPAMAPGVTIRAKANGSFPPASLARPRQNAFRSSPPASAKPLAMPKQDLIERLPPVDTKGPSELRSAPRPIPVYPATGY